MDARKTIIYVDDDFDDLEILREAFDEHPQCRLITVSKPTELFAILENFAETVHLIVMDVNMPLSNGYELAGELRASAFRAVPLVLLSTSNGELERQKAAALGITLLPKPHSLEEIRGIALQLLQYCQ